MGWFCVAGAVIQESLRGMSAKSLVLGVQAQGSCPHVCPISMLLN